MVMIIKFRGGDFRWTGMKMTPDTKWFSGGFLLNDHEIENPDPQQIKPQDHVDMSPFGTWKHTAPIFNSSASDDDKKGKVIISC